MKLLRKILKLRKTAKAKTIADYKNEMLIKTGRQQFKKLKDLGINIPVRLT